VHFSELLNCNPPFLHSAEVQDIGPNGIPLQLIHNCEFSQITFSVKAAQEGVTYANLVENGVRPEITLKDVEDLFGNAQFMTKNDWGQIAATEDKSIKWSFSLAMIRDGPGRPAPALTGKGFGASHLGGESFLEMTTKAENARRSKSNATDSVSSSIMTGMMEKLNAVVSMMAGMQTEIQHLRSGILGRVEKVDARQYGQAGDSALFGSAHQALTRLAASDPKVLAVVKGVEVRGQMPSPISNINKNGYGIGKNEVESEDELQAKEDLAKFERQLGEMRHRFPGADFKAIEAQINSMREIQKHETPFSGRGDAQWGGNDALAADQGSWAEGPTPIRLFGIDIVPGITKGDKLKADIQKLAFKESLKKTAKAALGTPGTFKLKAMNAEYDRAQSAAKNKIAARMEKRDKERAAKKKEKEEAAKADQSTNGKDGEKKEEKKRLDNNANAEKAAKNREELKKKQARVKEERERKAKAKEKREQRNKRVNMN